MNNVWDILSMLGSLALIILVLVLTYFATRWYARRMGRHTGSGKYIKVLEQTFLGAGAALAIVQVGDRYYLVGVSDKSVRLLSELPDFEGQLDTDPQQTSAPFSQIFRQLIGKSQEKDDDEGK